MADDLTQLDELIESDVLDALGEQMPQSLVQEAVEASNDESSDVTDCIALDDIDDLEILPMAEIESAIENDVQVQPQNINNINTTDLASLLSQLLNNKTIEITIKVKD